MAVHTKQKACSLWGEQAFTFRHTWKKLKNNLYILGYWGNPWSSGSMDPWLRCVEEAANLQTAPCTGDSPLLCAEEWMGQIQRNYFHNGIKIVKIIRYPKLLT